MRTHRLLAAVALASLSATAATAAERIGEVSTTWRAFGANDKIVVEAFEDPRVPGITCYLSRVTTGGISGSLGLAEDGSDASLACRQTGPVVDKTTSKPIPMADLAKFDKEDAFSAAQNLWFKTMHVRRFVDQKRNTLVYLTFSDKLIDGSPKNAISSVTIMPWPVATEPQR